MDKKYVHYTADELLNDDYFLQSELHPTDESRMFWEGLMYTDKYFAVEIESARFILAAIKDKSHLPELPEEEERELWRHIDKINISHQRRKVTFILLSSAAAAIIALLLILNWGEESSLKDTSTNYLALIESAQQRQDDSGDIQLILSDDKKFHLEGKETEIEYEENGEIRINSEKISLADKGTHKQIYNTLIVPPGKRSFLILADGTKLWVNSASKVIYPAKFDIEKREIFVEGEVYLDVSKNENQPFVVKTREMDIKVLGTQFNVFSMADESFHEVVLVSGRVEVKAKDTDSQILEPRELYKYDVITGESSTIMVDVTDHIAWKDGYYSFSSEPLDIILKKIARYYGMQIKWEKDISSLRCSGKLDLRDDPAEVFSLLKKAAPVMIEERNGEYLVKVKP